MNKYLVFYKIDGEMCDAVIATAREIFNKMDMDDCYPIRIANMYWIAETEVIPCEFYGTWHNLKEPLRMEIRTEIGEILDAGYGTDH